jgi:uncharacterized protein YndB with AHSA1/START domain
MSAIHLEYDYPHAPSKVWRALTDPALVPLWTSSGLGGRPVGFAPVVGTKFRFVARPLPVWRGFVECEVLEAREPSVLRYTWVGDEGDAPTDVAFRVEPRAGGTRLRFDHTGFVGLGGYLTATVLGRVRARMLRVGMSALLEAMDEHGALRSDSAFAT